jgi:peptidoglycan/xylan/chitin deacetylase (PgdA/CDA1 family)
MSSPETRTLAVLAYHKIGAPPPGGWKTWFYVPEEVFASHLQYLRENGWAVIPTGTLLAGLEDPAIIPEKSALLTFDDGYRSMRSVALPILRRFGHPAALFVPTAFLGGKNDFEGGGEPEEEICGWEDLRALDSSGVSIQSHGVSHKAFSELEPRQQEDELRRSREALESGLGKPVELFAYPYGDGGRDPRATVAAAERAGYKAALLYKGGPVRLPDADRYRLTRLAVGPDTDLGAELGEG